MPDDSELSTDSKIPVTDAELHYKSLTDLFKYLVTLAAIFIGLFAAAGCTYGPVQMISGLVGAIIRPTQCI
jgi:hypothetical protein